MASTSAYAAYSFPIVLILIPIHLPILLFLFSHRHSQVWKTGCSLELTYLLIIGFWFTSSWKLAASLDPSIPCFVNSAIAALAYFVVIVVYMQRALKVLFRFEIQAALDAFRHLPKEQQTIEALETGEGGWYFRHRNLVRNKYSFGYFFIAVALFAALLFGIASTEELTCDNFNTLDYVNWVIDILIVPFAITVACKMRRHPNDAFSIKKDLKWAGGWAIFITISSVAAHSVVDTKTADDENFFNSMVTVVTMLWLVGLSGYKQMYFLHKLDKELEEPDYTSLETLLKSEAGYNSYLNYLKTEFSGENLLFWQAVEDFRKKHLTSMDLVASFADCEQIIINYVRTGSPMELNIDTFLREELMESYHKCKETHSAATANNRTLSPKLSTNKLNAVSDDGVVVEVSAEGVALVTMFDHVQTIIFDLMRKDPFRRYLASPLYAKFKEEEDTRREHASSSTASSLKVMVDTVKKLSFLAPRTHTNRMSKSENDHSQGSSQSTHSSADRDSRHDEQQPEKEKYTPKKDKESRAFSFAVDSTPKLKPAVEMATATASSAAPTTPRGSSYVSPFGGAGDDLPSTRSVSYVSPFTAAGGGGLQSSTPRSDTYVSPFGGALTPRSDSHISPFGSSSAASTPVNTRRLESGNTETAADGNMAASKPSFDGSTATSSHADGAHTSSATAVSEGHDNVTSTKEIAAEPDSPMASVAQENTSILGSDSAPMLLPRSMSYKSPFD